MMVPSLILPEVLTDRKGIREVSVFQHANERIQYLWKDLSLLHGLGLYDSNAKVSIGKAPAQGRVSQNQGNQAAHPNFLSGLKTNFSEIVRRQGVKVHKYKNIQKVARFIEKQAESAYERRDIFDITRNYGARRQKTHEFDREVNAVDSGLENFLRGRVLPILECI